jgi:broad specificity phosphatase PhoE
MLEIILARHGQTEFNAKEIFRGQVDVPLNETGFKQAQLLGEYLSREKIDAVYTSPLSRAVKTAEAIAGYQKLGVDIVENLNDINCGQWQGMPVADVKEQYPDIYQDWLDTPEQVRLPGGESLADVRNRALPFVQNAVVRCGEGRIVVVSHRVVTKVLICALLTLDDSLFWSFKIDTAGITRFNFDGDRAVMTVHNDTSYLAPLKLGKKQDF